MTESAGWLRGLRARIVLVVAFAMLGPTLVVAWTAWTGLAHARRDLVVERARLGRSVADHLEYVVKSDLETLQSIGATLQQTAATLDDAAAERSAVREAYLRSRVLEVVLLLRDPSGIVWEEPARARQFASGVLDLPVTREVFAGGKPAVSDPVDEPGGRRVYLLVPLRDWQGRVARVAAGVIDPASERFLALLDPFRLGERGSTDVVDRAGALVATTASRGRHAGDDAADHPVAASVPLAVVPWRVVIREPEAEVIGSLATLGGRLVVMSAVVLVLGLGYAWGAAWSIERPLRVLTAAAARITGGNLTEPIPRLPDDEVGRLGRALDGMRVALGESQATLEWRVEERTAELERLYRELSARDRSRAELLRKVISAQEEERRRVARELHDETSQSLAALGMALDAVIAVVPAGAAQARLADARGIVRRALDELHRVLFDLRPSVLDDLGLASAIRWCAERHLEPLGIVARCEFSGLEERLPPEVETALFRVVQEAVTNIARHAAADTVLIQCAARDGRVTVEIEDDGRGFDATAPPAPTVGAGLGLAGMRERVALLGGTIEIDSAPGEGTRLALSVPAPVSAELAHA